MDALPDFDLALKLTLFLGVLSAAGIWADVWRYNHLSPREREAEDAEPPEWP